VNKTGYRYSVLTAVRPSERPPDSVRRPRSLAVLTATLLADLDGSLGALLAARPR
jgi:hypothetical protein